MRVSRNDLRIALRVFSRHPAFAIAAVASLAIAIALNTTMYSFLDAMVRPKLDVRDVDRFYNIVVFRDIRIQTEPGQLTAVLRSGGRTYDALTTATSANGLSAIEFDSHIDRAGGMHVAPNLFDVYGLRVVRGRGFLPTDATAETPPVVISDRLANRLSPDAPFPLDTAIMLDGVRRPVAGIIHGGALVAGQNHPDLFEPLAADVPANIVRLKRGVSIDDAKREFKQLAMTFALMTGDAPKITVFDLRPLAESQFHLHLFHLALIAAVIAVLLIACANLANLQLARGISRGRELALRTALGARRADLIAQLVLESAVLAIIGLVLGLVATFWSMHALAARVPPSIADYVIEPQISWRLFVVAVVATILCVMVIGLLPAIRVSRADPNDLLKSGAGTGATIKHRRQYAVMVVVELGLSLALLSGAALVIRSAIYVHLPQTTFDAKLVSQSMMFLMTKHDTSFDVPAYAYALTQQLRSSPDVENAAVKYSRRAQRHAITINENGGMPHEYDAPMVSYWVTTADYFRTLGLPIVRGRNFSDAAAVEAEVIVDERTARVLWPGGTAVGQEIKLGAYSTDAPWSRVVGVVPEEWPSQARFDPTAARARIGNIYVSQPATDISSIRWRRAELLYIVARARRDPARLPTTVQRLLPHAGTGIVYNVGTASMEEYYGIAREQQRHDFVASVFMTFALTALGLASLGIYGIVAHSVAERRRELGVRLALGASTRDILNVVLREGNAVALAGVAFGLLMTRFTAGWLDAFIIEDDQYNAPVFAIAATILFIVVVVAALRPALVATRIDPSESLRCE